MLMKFMIDLRHKDKNTIKKLDNRFKNKCRQQNGCGDTKIPSRKHELKRQKRMKMKFHVTLNISSE